MAKANDRKEIAIALSEKYGIPRKQAERFVQTFFDVLSDGLHQDKLVKVKGLGTFKVIDVKDRESVNIQTGERFLIEGRGRITFTPDAVMKELVNKPFSQFETVILNDGVDFSEIDSANSSEFVDSISTNDVTDDNDETMSSEDNSSTVVPPSMMISGEEESSETIIESEPVIEKIVDPLDFNDPPEEETSSVDDIGVPEETDSIPDEELKVTEEESIVHEEESFIPEEELVLSSEKESHPDVVLTAFEASTLPNEEESVPPHADVSNDADSVSDEVIPIEERKIEEESNIDNEPIEETDMEEEHSSIWSKLLAFVIVAALAFGIGYWLGNRFTPRKYIPVGESEMIDGLVHDSIMTDSTSVQDSLLKAKDALIKAKVDSVTRLNEARNDSIRAARAKKEADDRAKTATEQSVSPNTSVQHTPEPVVETRPQTNDAQVLSTARSIMAHGAYNIVGTAQTITVKKGQTMRSISKTYLGSEMACYIQCHNNVAEVTEGMKLKIPKLELKKKK